MSTKNILINIIKMSVLGVALVVVGNILAKTSIVGIHQTDSKNLYGGACTECAISSVCDGIGDPCFGRPLGECTGGYVSGISTAWGCKSQSVSTACTPKDFEQCNQGYDCYIDGANCWANPGGFGMANTDCDDV